MADQRSGSNTPRRTRKEILLSRKEQEQYRQIRLIIIGVVALMSLILIGGATYEYVIVPNRPIAIVNDERITVREWQQRVRYERGQLIASVESLAALFEDSENAAEQIQQFAGQQIQLLLRANKDVLGQSLLQQMIDEALIRQAAEAEGIEVSDEEVQGRIEAQFGYFGGVATPEPTPTATVPPTPSVTPIGAADEPAEGEAEVTPLPTSTPLPTATPVSAAGFEELFAAELENVGGNEELYRELVRMTILTDRFRDTLADDVATEEEQVSLLLLTFREESDAVQAQADIATGDFITVWNTIRSTDRITNTQPLATEINWVTRENLVTRTDESVAAAAFDVLEVDGVSEILQQVDDETGDVTYYIVQLRGRQMRPLPQSTIDEAKNERLNAWLDEERLAGGVELFENWLGRAPERPVLDPSIYLGP